MFDPRRDALAYIRILHVVFSSIAHHPPLLLARPRRPPQLRLIPLVSAFRPRRSSSLRMRDGRRIEVSTLVLCVCRFVQGHSLAASSDDVRKTHRARG